MGTLASDRAVLSFNKGEISKRMAGRAEIALTANACRTLRNCTVGVYGSTKRRPGLVLIAAVKT